MSVFHNLFHDSFHLWKSQLYFYTYGKLCGNIKGNTNGKKSLTIIFFNRKRNYIQGKIKIKQRNKTQMRKAQKTEFFKKMSDYASKKLTYLVDVEKWENQELSEKSGIPQNRLSEIRNKQRAMTEFWLKALISGGLITVEDIKKSVPLDNDEKKYLNGLKFLKETALLESVKAALAEGIDSKLLKSLIDDARKNHQNQ